MVTSTRYMYYIMCIPHMYIHADDILYAGASMNTGKIYEGLYTSVKVEAHSNELKSCVCCYLHV